MAGPRHQIELPHLRNGEVDWKTLGNMLTAHMLGEVLHASYVDYKYGQKTSDYQVDTSWEFFYEENDVIVLRKRFSNSPLHAWMGRCVINLPVEDVATFLKDHSNRKYFDKYLAGLSLQQEHKEAVKLLFEGSDALLSQWLPTGSESQTLPFQLWWCSSLLLYKTSQRKERLQYHLSMCHPETYEKRRMSDNDVIMYLHLQATQCLVKQHRDFIYYERIGYVDRKFVRSDLSVDIPEYGPVQGITRAEMLPGTGWVLQPYEGNKTLVSFCAHIDLKNLPPLIVNRAARRSPMCVYHLREFLTNPDYRRKYEKASTPIRSVDDLTASERDFVDQQSIQTSNTHQRFLAEQQLSVKDYLKNRPNLRRNHSASDASTRLQGNEFEQRSSTKRRSHSHSDSVASGRDLNDMAEESSRFSASQSSSVICSTYPSTNGTNGFHNQEPGETGDNVKSKAEHDQALDQASLHPFSGEGEEKGSTPPFLTPEVSSEEVSPSTSHYYSPLESQDNLSSDGEHIELLPSTPEPTRQAEESGVGGHTDMDATLRDSSALVNNSAIT